MTTGIYQIWCAESSVPLTVYANDREDAESAFDIWRSINMSSWSGTVSRLEEMDDEWLRDRPQLKKAVEWARKSDMHNAVLVFRNHEAGWIATPPNSERIGAIAPVEPLVRSFEARIKAEGLEGVDALVFTLDVNHALELYLAYRGEVRVPSDTPIVIREFSRWTLTGGHTRLREEMDVGTFGVAGWAPVTGWKIYPPDHDLAGGY